MDSTIKFTIPEGYVLDKEHSTDKELVYKPSVPTYSNSWEQFCEKFPKVSLEELFIDIDSEIVHYTSILNRGPLADRNLFPTRYGEAFIALMQLLTIREKEYIPDGWKPSGKDTYWAVFYKPGKGVTVGAFYESSRVLSFPTERLAEEFLKNWESLIEKAKDLL